MKAINCLFLLLLLSVTPAFGQCKNNGENAGDNPAQKSVKGFGAQLLIVEKPQEFIQEWSKPETPHINPVSVAKRGEPLGVLVLFAGCKPDSKGVCNAEVDYTIYKPDGSIYGEQKAQELWKLEAPPVPNIQLGRAILVLRIEKKDPAGEYKAKARVHDLNADVSFELETRLGVPAS
jgi:hypothetical protein